MTPECLEITRKKHKQIDQIVLSNICNILDSFAQPFDKTESLLENILSTETIQKEWKQLIHMWIDYLMENELVKEEQGVYRRTSAWQTQKEMHATSDVTLVPMMQAIQRIAKQRL